MDWEAATTSPDMGEFLFDGAAHSSRYPTAVLTEGQDRARFRLLRFGPQAVGPLVVSEER